MPQRTSTIPTARTARPIDYVAAAAVVVACTALAALATPYIGLANADALYLLAVVVVAARYGRGPAILTSCLGLLAFDYFIVPPPFGFVPEDAISLVTLAVMLAVALTVSALADLALAAQRAEFEADRERVRNTLLHSVSHDLRTPIAAIQGAASTLLQTEALDPRTRRELLQSICQASERLGRQVSNILEATRLEAGSVRVSLEWTPIDEVVGAALTALADRIGERRVNVSLPQDLPPLPLDGLLAQQVVTNLVDNALRHTPADSPIDVAARQDAQHVVLAIGDRGPGIPAGERERIFTKFHRLDERKADGGTGLGLAISRTIMDLLGGRLWVEPREGGGATFVVAFPRTSGALPAVGPDPPELDSRP
jgi:two-component system sensor histidine kinase KdpD